MARRREAYQSAAGHGVSWEDGVVLGMYQIDNDRYSLSHGSILAGTRRAGLPWTPLGWSGVCWIEWFIVPQT